MLIGVQRERVRVNHQDGMKDVIYDYITGKGFRQRVKMIMGAYKKMQEDLETEKRSMKRIWKSRETQISTVLDNFTEMYGEIEGLLGGQATLPDVDMLSLEGIVEQE